MSEYIDRLKRFAKNPKMVFALPQVKKLIEYAANFEESQSQWISVNDRLPENTESVLVTYLNSCGKRRAVKAFYAKRFSVEADINFECYDEYSEEHDMYFLKEGWYEEIDNWPDYTSVFIHEGKPDFWQPLPQMPKAE